MSPLKIVALLLVVGGIVGLVYGGFTYTKSTHDAKIGPLEFSVKDKERVNVPGLGRSRRHRGRRRPARHGAEDVVRPRVAGERA